MAGITFDDVTKTYGDGFRAVSDLNLDVRDGEFVVLVGPSGCGKTTALRMIAGLEEISDGQIRIGERVVNNLPPGDRDIAMVFQNYALYPHMTVAENIGFALRMRKVPKAEARQRIAETARIIGLVDHLDRKPGQLSGGQRQRVAMGRAIVREPQVFLMDEPLSNLDAKLRVQMRAEISRIQRQLAVTTVYVTHDQVEAMTMGDRVAVMRRGLLQQFDAPQSLYERPANLFVASFIGSPAMNVLEGSLERRGDELVCHIGAAAFTLPAEVLSARPALARHVGKPIAVGIRPEALDEPGRRDGGDGGSRLRGRVQAVEALGPEQLAHVEVEAKPVLVEDVLEGLVDAEQAEDLAEIMTDADAKGARADVVARLDASASLRPDDAIELAVDVRRLHFFDLDSGEAIGAEPATAI
jgi:multiple sugar transport system ATP-binding protein